MNVKCDGCDWTGPASEAVEHSRVHDVNRFTKQPTVEAIPAWMVDCAGSCKGTLGYHVVLMVDNDLACDCPANQHKHKCRHAKAVSDAKFPQYIGDGPLKELDRLIGVMGRHLEPDDHPVTTLSRLRMTHAAMRTQLGYVKPDAGKPTPIYAHDTESIEGGNW